MNTYFRYYDSRYGDTYEVYTTHDGEFHSARRSVDTIGQDPIYYESLEEVPPFHRLAIEQLIVERQNKKDVD